MAADELNAPLGQKQRKRPPKLPIGGAQLLAGLLGLFGLAVVVWAVFGDDPLGGEPVAIVATVHSEPGKAATAGGTGENTRHEDNNSIAVKKAPIPPAGSKTVTIIDGSSGERRQVVIPGNSGDGTAKAPDNHALLETTRHGFIPKVGASGARPLTAYAHHRTIADDKKDWPRIAIIVGGLGVSASGTAEAMTKLPVSVTYALMPYGDAVGSLAERARAEKHELLLQVPMEPFDYPNNDPGPYTLLTSLEPEQNIDRLHWLMSRFGGYVGLISYMGNKFTASERALSPVLRDTAKRGLIYVDSGASPRSVAGQIAGGQNLPFAKVDVVLDSVPTSAEIDQALARLELKARQDGSAVGFATALPGTVARIATWVKTVENRGFVLVPITMVAVKAKSS